MPNRIVYNQALPNIERSESWHRRAAGLIPSFTQTLAKGPTQYVAGVAPKYLVRGKGAHVWDADDNEFIDLTMGVGPVSLGYAYPAVDRAIVAQLEQGISFSLTHPLEVETAELVRKLVPGAENVRFSKTGCDVTSAAVRVARAFTGRERVLCAGYHGWHDWYIGTTPRRGGVPEGVRGLTQTFKYNDLDSVLAQLNAEVACVILEPIIFEEPRNSFLQELQRACQRAGALLIFDEMWTGFRIALGGAQQYYDVKADLACFSKAIANGMPLSVLTGRADVMNRLDRDVFFYTTFGGETLSLAAACATLKEMQDADVMGHIARTGRRLKEGYNALAAEFGLGFTRSIGLDCRSLVTFDPSAGDPLELKSLLQQELIRHGVLWSGFHNPCFSHTEADVDHVLGAYRLALPVLGEAVAKGDVRARILGEPVQPVFRKTT